MYFQFGLILCLLFTYGLLELKFEQHQKDLVEFVYEDPDDYITYINPVIEQPRIEQPLKKVEPKRLIDKYKVEPVNNKNNDAKSIIIDPPTKNVPLAINDIIDVDPPPPATDIPFHIVEMAPIFPGCEKAKNNIERKKCMSE